MGEYADRWIMGDKVEEWMPGWVGRKVRWMDILTDGGGIGRWVNKGVYGWGRGDGFTMGK